MRIAGAFGALKNLAFGADRKELEKLVGLASQDLHDVVGCIKANPELVRDALKISWGSDQRGTMISFDWIAGALDGNCYPKDLVRRDSNGPDDYLCLFFPVQGQQKECISGISGYWNVSSQSLIAVRIDHYYAPYGQAKESICISALVHDAQSSNAVKAVQDILYPAGKGNQWRVTQEPDGKVGVARIGAEPLPKLSYAKLPLDLNLARDDQQKKVILMANPLDFPHEYVGSRPLRDAWMNFRH